MWLILSVLRALCMVVKAYLSWPNTYETTFSFCLTRKGNNIQWYSSLTAGCAAL